DFDKALFGHIGYAISNAARSFVLAMTHAKFSDVPVQSSTSRYYQNINRYSAAFALTADFAMLTLGGRLKIKERLSARLGDIFSYMYMASAVLKHYENQGRQPQDLPLVEWSVRTLMYQAQEQLHKFLQNFPNRPVAWLLRALIFPRGRTYSAPSDRIGQNIVELMISPSGARDRLCQEVYREQHPDNALGMLQAALEQTVVVSPLQRKLREAEKAGTIKSSYLPHQVEEALDLGLIDNEEAKLLSDYHEAVSDLIAVDDFDPSEIGQSPLAKTATKTSTKKTTTKKKTTRKKAVSKKTTSKKKVAKKTAKKTVKETS
ncbi:MAG: DUF1974 domain-containing protein, partial [Pseudomonadota bacterium]